MKTTYIAIDNFEIGCVTDTRILDRSLASRCACLRRFLLGMIGRANDHIMSSPSVSSNRSTAQSRRTPQRNRSRRDSTLDDRAQKQLVVDLGSKQAQVNPHCVSAWRPDLYGDPDSGDPHQKKKQRATYDKIRQLVALRKECPEEFL